MRKDYYVFRHNYYRCIYFCLPLWLVSRGIGVMLHIGSPFVKSAIIHFAMMLLFFTLGFLSLFYLIRSLVEGHKKIVSPYRKGDYLEAHGQVKIICKSTFGEGKADRFDVNGVVFEVVLFNPLPGYNRQVAYGGVDFSAGDFLEIKYVCYQTQNRIMELRVCKSMPRGGDQ